MKNKSQYKSVDTFVRVGGWDASVKQEKKDSMQNPFTIKKYATVKHIKMYTYT